MDKEVGNMKLRGYKNIQGVIEVITGLHIGGSTTMIEIGGKDNPVIKNPLTKEPYIPGSSLKGKMRSLLEWKLGKITSDGDVHKWCNDTNCPICVIFGTSADEAGLGPTRLIVRDAVLDEDYRKSQKEKNSSWTVLDLTEDKYENTINRITARANPRNFERVISGAKFKFSMSYRVFDDATDENLFAHVLESLKLIEKDALGGAGSRGCGQIKFVLDVNSQKKTLEQVSSQDFETME